MATIKRSPLAALHAFFSTFSSAIFSVGLLIGSATVQAESEPAQWAVSAELSSTGIGADVIYGFTPKLQLRSGINAFSVSRDYTANDGNDIPDDEVDYQGDLDLLTVGSVLDWYPSGKHFRLSAGLFYNGNEFKGNGRCESATGNCEFGDSTFNSALLGTVNAEVTFNRVAPYLGIGYGNPLQRAGWGVTGDVGILVQGKPNATLFATGGCNVVDDDPTGLFVSQQACLDIRDAEIADEEEKLQDTLDRFQVYPVVNLGVSYRF